MLSGADNLVSGGVFAVRISKEVIHLPVVPERVEILWLIRALCMEVELFC